MNEYAFEVKLRAFVRVRASDKNEASKVAELVLGAPSSLEIGLANENNNAALGCAAAVTAVTFQQTGDPRVVRDSGPKIAEGHIVETSGLVWHGVDRLGYGKHLPAKLEQVRKLRPN